MKQISAYLISLLFLLSGTVSAQKKTTKPTAQKPAVTKSTEVKKTDTVADEKKVKDIISFLEYMLNTLGSSGTPVRDKEVLITESYAKIFRDSKVQVEDDLDEERKVITNKDIVAYLKDVNFFFTNVRFEFTIENIESSTTTGGLQFYKVTTTRNLTGITSEQKSVNKTLKRYIEINYNPADDDLKIVSIYTNQYDDKQALMNWWSGLSYEWQKVFKRKLNITDSVQLDHVKDMTSISELDISRNIYIQSLEPLSLLYNLKTLDISSTGISDLTPIRNLTELVELNLSDTKISDLSPLKYAARLEYLNINKTAIEDVSVLGKLQGLRNLKMSRTMVNDFTPIAQLNSLNKADLSETRLADLSPFETLLQLTELNVSGTPVKELDPIKGLKGLQILELDSTGIRNINVLEDLTSLTLLRINYTAIADLTPLQKLVSLEKIYCDQTGINKEKADSFMLVNQKVLVIYDSRDLQAWWETLPDDWHRIFIRTTKISAIPSKEELAKIPLLDSINLSGETRINNLDPLNKLLRLRIIIANKTKINDLSPLHAHKDIQYMDISETEIKDLALINHFTLLKVLIADHSKIEKIDELNIPSLEIFYADHTNVQDISAMEFLTNNSSCTLIFKTDRLNQWWSNLSEPWKDVFTDQIGTKNENTTENLHRLVEKETLHFKDVPITDVSALSEFIRLKELHFSGTAMTSLSPIENIKSLKSLHATNSPIKQIDQLDQLTQLEDLDISNTPIEDLTLISKLRKLVRLNCAGTQIKKLNGIEKLQNLEYLDCSNTNVSKLDQLDQLPLKSLRCYNTKVSSKEIEKFKSRHPDCNVVYYR